MRMKLLVAASATVFIAVIISAVVTQLTMTPASAASQTAITTTQTPVPVVDELAKQREATYQARLVQANQTIAQSQTELQKAQATAAALAQKYNDAVTAPPAATAVPARIVPTAPPAATAVPARIVPTAPPAATAVPARIVPAAAFAIAQSLDPNVRLLQEATIVPYQNVDAYEFVFDRGTVYVAAANGDVLANNIVPPTAGNDPNRPPRSDRSPRPRHNRNQP
jgi:hypothetical protein